MQAVPTVNPEIFGSTPKIWKQIATEMLTRGARVSAYITYLVPSNYPALGFGETGPVDVQVNLPEAGINRIWGIPVFGVLARFVVLIPHFIVTGALGAVSGLIGLWVWVPVLRNSRYPDVAMRFVGLYIKYQSRVFAYLLFLPVPYPPFDFEM